MKDDIRKATGLIIRKSGEFLIGRCMVTKELRWGWSPYDAWRTRSREDARKVAGRAGGEIMLFNPVTGQLREYRPAEEMRVNG